MIPDETLHALLTLVRAHLPSHVKDEDDDEYHVAPPKRSSASAPKSKKNKPMSKYEQEKNISRIKEQLEGFQKNEMSSKSPESQLLYDALIQQTADILSRHQSSRVERRRGRQWV